ncbi:MAG: hypothetical protein AMJ66_07635 [Betaproteobacteria bacterium SG8_40]|nr:MAG: hypothetical protein AMJ66_07635 [Betaproteobacteria bacterium SG8_40]
MKKTVRITLWLLLGSFVLAGCSDVDVEAEGENRFAIVSNAGMSQPILLNQESGETWRLTDEGWQPIQALDRKGRAVDWKDLDD